MSFEVLSSATDIGRSTSISKLEKLKEVRLMFIDFKFTTKDPCLIASIVKSLDQLSKAGLACNGHILLDQNQSIRGIRVVVNHIDTNGVNMQSVESIGKMPSILEKLMASFKGLDPENSTYNGVYFNGFLAKKPDICVFKYDEKYRNTSFYARDFFEWSHFIKQLSRQYQLSNSTSKLFNVSKAQTLIDIGHLYNCPFSNHRDSQAMFLDYVVDPINFSNFDNSMSLLDSYAIGNNNFTFLQFYSIHRPNTRVVTFKVGIDQYNLQYECDLSEYGLLDTARLLMSESSKPYLSRAIS